MLWAVLGLRQCGRGAGSRSLLAGLSRFLPQNPCTDCSDSALLGLFQLTLRAGWDGAGTGRER